MPELQKKEEKINETNSWKGVFNVILFLATMYIGVKIIIFLFGYLALLLDIIFKHLAENRYVYLGAVSLILVVFSFICFWEEVSKCKDLNMFQKIKITLTEILKAFFRNIIGVSFFILLIALFFIFLGGILNFISRFFNSI